VRLVASLGHVVKVFIGGGGMDSAGLSGMDLDLMQSLVSEGNPRSSDQSMVAFSINTSMGASARSFFVAIEFCLLVWATLGETLDLGFQIGRWRRTASLSPMWVSSLELMLAGGTLR
jgi:hypothetical protein